MFVLLYSRYPAHVHGVYTVYPLVFSNKEDKRPRVFFSTEDINNDNNHNDNNNNSNYNIKI